MAAKQKYDERFVKIGRIARLSSIVDSIKDAICCVADTVAVQNEKREAVVKSESNDGYSIDLQDIEYLHWWKFKALLRTLSSDLEFSKIMEYRSVDIDATMTKEQRDFYRRKKELYALPLPADEEEKVDAIAEALMNGGDLTGLL